MMYIVNTNKGNRFEIVSNTENTIVDKAIVEGLATNYYIKNTDEIIIKIEKKYWQTGFYVL